jgi:serine/threonine-protein kinase Chk2
MYGFLHNVANVTADVAPEILQDSKHRKYTRAVDIWSLGVVLYICLCGFPPFADEIYSPKNPYTLADQILMGRFDYPSPYWDHISDPALDLIDRMLTVSIDERITIDECLEHPWLTKKFISLYDSTDGLTGAMGNLDFSKRKPQRERTLLSSLNDAKIPHVISIESAKDPLTIFVKNPDAKQGNKVNKSFEGTSDEAPKSNGRGKEMSPATNREVQEFMNMGGKGDLTLFSDDPESLDSAHYSYQNLKSS